ncbi:hypothetical protein FIU88_08295 [Halomonas sp. THAF12]|uniref:hypothetical protein n=1 Tax=Halomonas sp. THAF12 TaxID=2587849 RepID=UPI00126939EA|nr:hypothetical protein [Halomonas sp. THAF12]QFT84974.1 hypothetical protein FIU88_08295 [Halomonas sp. THAF12]
MALSLKGRSGDMNESRWFQYDDDTEVLVARWDNPKYTVGLQRFRTVYQEKRNRLLKEAEADGRLRFTDDMAEVDDDEQTEVEAQSALMARHILLDMRTPGRDDGKVMIDGEPCDYTIDLGETLLEMNVELFVWVIQKAQELQRDAFSLAEGAEKKPSKSSAGKSSGGRKKSTMPSRSS